MKIAAVMPVGAGREHNVEASLRALEQQKVQHDLLVAVLDGTDVPSLPSSELEVIELSIPKHQPGDEQPRNLGVRAALSYDPDITHVHFVDSDVLLHPFAVDELRRTVHATDEPGIVIAPYEWMGPGDRSIMWELHNDPRWQMFATRANDGVIRGDLSVGLGCFSGNLLWRVDEFERVGGFWAELHHGRCEDGELGLRAVAMDVGIAMSPAARGWHLWHEINVDVVLARNARDVPMLNERHPWVETDGLELTVDREGAAFDVNCKVCGEVVPTGNWWEHCGERGHSTEILHG